MLLGVALGLTSASAVSGLPAGWGGAVGLAGAHGVACGHRPDPTIRRSPALSRFAALLLFALAGLALRLLRARSESRTSAGGFRVCSSLAATAARRARDDRTCEERTIPAAPPRSKPAVAVAEPSPQHRSRRPRGAQRKPRGRNSRRLALGDSYQLPTLDLLAPPPEDRRQPIDQAGLERNARLLETVLDDFNVKGEIVEVRPGPVVTMYELEPASGIKASRVIALADDIARNMSALSARVATIPGRTVIGIELPNAKREMVSLSELIGSQAFEDQTVSLPLILGKNIAGDPVIADLAPMPHLLVAGTTGSGKSVGLNCMILSLLYRLTPDQCKMIMIDPKMLELSMYDDIPHLLAPVVTEPAKAVRALKWTVEQMEERYRMMAGLGVRACRASTTRCARRKAKGQPLGRRVQTGYDPETGQPIYEKEQLDYDVLPQIVVIVDELADLMMTAGKEVEFLIQRLAQKARAAGIHLIMATQRPSVDVITGVIKANLPTRISFHVTSKIDSRTILGEQGAEQLLGKGDMLYMPGGKQIVRVHGPFVSDDEVRAVADHWRAQGEPDYIQAVTEEPEDGGYLFDGAADRRGRCRGPALSQGDPARRRKPEGLDLLAPAPAAGRLQHRRAADRADGEGRHRRAPGPCRPPRSAARPRRAPDLRLNGRNREVQSAFNGRNAMLGVRIPGECSMTFSTSLALASLPCARRSSRRRRSRSSPTSRRSKRICAAVQTMTADFTQTDAQGQGADRHADAEAPRASPLPVWKGVPIADRRRRQSSDVPRLFGRAEAALADRRIAARRAARSVRPTSTARPRSCRATTAAVRRSRGARSSPNMGGSRWRFCADAVGTGRAEAARLGRARCAEQPHDGPAVGRSASMSPVPDSAFRFARAQKEAVHEKFDLRLVHLGDRCDEPKQKLGS